MERREYLHLKPGDEPPILADIAPFKAVVVIEAEVTPGWRDLVSAWLVRSGCLYMMAWGTECSEWDTSVDYANMKMFECGAIPEDKFVRTTYHEDEPLEEVFFFCKFPANHPEMKLDTTYIIHIAPNPGMGEMLKAFDELQG